MKFLNLLFLIVISVNIFAFEPVSLKIENKNLQKIHPNNINLQKKEPLNLNISDIHIGTTQEGEWFFGFYLQNNSDVVLRKNQIRVKVFEPYQNNYHDYGGIERDISPQKKILVRHVYHHGHEAKSLTVKIFEKGVYLPTSKTLELPNVKLKDFVSLKTLRLINGHTLEYCIENRTGYNFTISLFTQVGAPTRWTKADKEFLLKSKSHKCGTVRLNVIPSSKDTIRIFFYDKNGGSGPFGEHLESTSLYYFLEQNK